MTNSVSELEDADCIFVIGSNTTSSHPLVATRIFRALEKGGKLIVADPRKIQLAPMADIYVSQNPTPAATDLPQDDGDPSNGDESTYDTIICPVSDRP